MKSYYVSQEMLCFGTMVVPGEEQSCELSMQRGDTSALSAPPVAKLHIKIHSTATKKAVKEELILKAGYSKKLQIVERDAKHSGPFLTAVIVMGA